MNKHFVFRSSKGNILSFFLANIPGLIVNNGSMFLLINNGLNDVYAQIATIVLVAIVNFNMFKFIFVRSDKTSR
jgi:putative flippase GtrA